MSVRLSAIITISGTVSFMSGSLKDLTYLIRRSHEFITAEAVHRPIAL